MLLLFLLNTFTTSDTTSMSATLTFNRISVKSVKRKREAVLGVSVSSDIFLLQFVGKQSLKSGVKRVKFHANVVLFHILNVYTFRQSDSCLFDR